MSQLSEADRRFLEHRRTRRTLGLYLVPAALLALVVGWGAFFVWLPLTINPFHAIGYFEGRVIEPGTVTTYAVVSALLVNALFVVLALLLALTTVWAARERRYLRLLDVSRGGPAQGSSARVNNQ